MFFLSHTRLYGKLTIRIAISNLRTTEQDVSTSLEKANVIISDYLASENLSMMLWTRLGRE